MFPKALLRWGLAAALALCASLGSAMSQSDYEQTFLDQADLPDMRRTQDGKAMGPDADDQAYGSLGGEHTGLVVWMGSMDAPVWRLVDIRTVLPSEDAAQEYMEERGATLSEGRNPIPGAPTVGQDCQVFGGAEEPMPGMLMVNYFYVFRVHNVVVKLYAAQGPKVQGKVLTAEMLAPYARKIVRRIEKVTGGGSSSPSPPRPPPPPPEPSPPTPIAVEPAEGDEGELELPVTALRVQLPTGTRWTVRAETAGDVRVDSLRRIAPAAPSIEVAVGLVSGKDDCKSHIDSLASRSSFERTAPPLPDGYYPVALREQDASVVCAETRRGLLNVAVSPALAADGDDDSRAMLQALIDAARVRVAEPEPSPAPTPDEPYDPGFDFEWTFEGAQFAAARLQLAGIHLNPKGVHDLFGVEESFGLTVMAEFAPVIGDPDDVVGIAADVGLELGFNKGLGDNGDSNFPFDARFGVGPGFWFGPVTLAPYLGVGLNTLGGGDEDDDFATPPAAFTMDIAFYWYAGGRARFGIGPVGLEAYAVRTFRGGLFGEQGDDTVFFGEAGDVGNETRFIGRLAVLVAEEHEASLGFLYTDYDAALGATGMGGLLGYGLHIDPDEWD